MSKRLMNEMNLVTAFYLLWYLAWWALPIAATLPEGAGGKPHPLGIDYTHMFCRGELPEGNYGEPRVAWEIRTRKQVTARGWENWNKHNFSTLADLCSAHGNPEGNLGGKCTTDGKLFFHTRLAEAMFLYEANLEGYCRRNCFCPENDDDWLRESQREAMSKFGITIPTVSSTAPYSTRPPAKGMSLYMDPHDPYNSRQGFYKNPPSPMAYSGKKRMCKINSISKDLDCGFRYPPGLVQRPTLPKNRPSPYRHHPRLGMSPPIGLLGG